MQNGNDLKGVNQDSIQSMNRTLIMKLLVVMGKELIEMFIGGLVAFSYRSYTDMTYKIGVFAQDCNVEYHNISFTN